MASQVLSALSIAPRTVRVTLDAAADATALTAKFWTFTASGTGPYYTPVAASVADTAVPPTTTPTVVDITLDQECTPNVLYTVRCSGVTGITADAIHNIALFWPLVPQSNPARDFSIIDILPPVNIADDSTGDLQKYVACLQEVGNLLWSTVDSWGDIVDIDHAPPNFLDVILAQLGNPVEVSSLSVLEKRRLAALLVSLYKIKGTIPGIKAAIKFFVTGVTAQVYNFFGMGSQIGTLGHDTGVHLGGPGDGGTWLLGGGDPWALTVKCGTAGGVPLTSDQLARVTEIVNKTKPSVSHVIQINASWPAPARLDIKDNGAGSITITCAPVNGATGFQTFWRAQVPGVNEWNGAVLALVGTGPAAATLTPGETRYWAACATNVDTSIPGLITNEITNALTAPVATATAQTRGIQVTWPAVTGATSYRVYKSLTAKVQPSAADNAGNPLRVEGTTFNDPMESGITRYYIVVPMLGDAESFYSNEVHATSL